ncbi:hypothetical protein BT638P8_00023 [Bacteroides phage BT638P8]|nr:hypothetical protein BT638P8_00023 [Bacteroides phage BT638P8]
MSNFVPVLKRFREIFDIAADVKDTEINKCIQEADKLDIKVALCGDTFSSVPMELGGGKGLTDIPAGTDTDSNYSLDVDIDGKIYNIVPLSTILCYYAFVRYLKSADQKSTSTGLKIQQYGNSVILPDYNKNKRWEEERGKADAFIEDFQAVYEMYRNSQAPSENDCCNPVKPYRVCFIT